MEMNKSYDELDTNDAVDIEAQQKIYETRESRDKCKKRGKNILLFLWGICLICNGYIILKYLQDAIEPDDRYTRGKDHLLNDNTTKRQLRIRWHTHHEDPCPKYKYGCCEVFSECSYKGNNITHYDSHEFKGSTFHIIKENEMGTNCPRMIDLVRGHNEHYPRNESCETSELGCCKIETECDINLRINDMIHKDNTQAHYEINDDFKYVHLVDPMEDRCPSIEKLMSEYRYNYPKKDNLWDGSEIFIVILVLGCLSLLGSAK